MGLHYVQHGGAGAGAAQRFQEGHRQGVHEAGVPAQGGGAEADRRQHRFEHAAGAQHGDGGEHGHEIGNQLHRQGEAFLGAFHEAVVAVDAGAPGGEEEQPDHRQKNAVAEQPGQGVAQVRRRQINAQRQHRKQRQPAQRHRDQQRVAQRNALQPGGEYHADKGGNRGGHQHRQVDRRRVGGALLGPVQQHRHRHQGHR